MLQLRCWGNFKAQRLQLNARCGNRQRGAGRGGRGAGGRGNSLLLKNCRKMYLKMILSRVCSYAACLPAACQFVDYVAIIWAQTATPRTLHTLLPPLSAWQLQLQLVAATSVQHKQTKQYGNVRCDAFPILLFWLLVSLPAPPTPPSPLVEILIARYEHLSM